MKGLLLVAHGSRREASNSEFTEMVRQLCEHLEGPFMKVRSAFLEFASPGIEQALRDMIQAGIIDIKVYPFFLNSGKHVHHDLPEKLRKVQQAYPEARISLLPHFGSSVHIASVIIQDLKEY